MHIENIISQFHYLEEHLLLKQLAIIFIYALLAKLVGLFLDKVLRRFSGRTFLEFDDQFLAFFHAPVYWSVFAFGLIHALSLRALSPFWNTVLPNSIKSLTLLIWFFTTFKIIGFLATQKVFAKAASEKIGNDLVIIIRKLVNIIVIFSGIYWILSIWQVSLTPFFASAGIAGIAVAMAAKDSLANFFGGISLFMDKSFKVGDYVIIDNGDRGEVVELGIRSTRIKTRDDVLITIPNSILANSKIINESAPISRFRIRIPVGVAYGSDIDHVEALLMRVAVNTPNIVKDPEPRVRLRGFGASSLDFELLLWVEDPSQKGLQTHHLLKSIYKAFNAEGVAIPFPQLDIHFDKGPAVFPGAGNEALGANKS